MQSNIKAKNKTKELTKEKFFQQMCHHFGIKPNKKIFEKIKNETEKGIIHEIIKMKENEKKEIRYQDIILYRNQIQQQEERIPTITELINKFDLNNDEIIHII